MSRQQTADSRQSASPFVCALRLCAVCCVLCAGTGCEGLQKKFVRKPKAHVRPSPIVTFQDYTRAMTPMDRYRKHYALFDYWNSQLLEALQVQHPGQPLNPKRAQKASGESLQELTVLRGLLVDEAAAGVDQVLEERTAIDQQIQRGDYHVSQLAVMRRTLETQTRQIQRELYWRNVEDRLKVSTDAIE